MKDVAMHPLREIPQGDIMSANKEDLRPVNMNDFIKSLQTVRPSVSKNSIAEYAEWHRQTGSIV